MTRFQKILPWLVLVAAGIAVYVAFVNGWDWMIPIISAVAAALGVLRSKPSNRAWARASVVLILVIGTWQAYREYSSGLTKIQLRRRAYQNLVSETAGFASHLSEFVVRSSDGWLPRNDADLFSARTAQMVCSELDITKNAPVIPRTSLLNWALDRNRSFSLAIHRALTEDSAALDAELVRILSKVERTLYLQFAKQRLQLISLDQSRNIERPPLMCWGLEPLAAESFSDFLALIVQLKKQQKTLQLEWPEADWLKFPDHYRQQFLGIGRFSPEDLQKWRAEHPNNPGPAIYGTGDPNKN
ncbi:MAG: hypothetical protein HY234_06995 [Acidobacteria bacterium]|nr:hypothetical protein [Acidobacteriota bacterium]